MKFRLLCASLATAALAAVRPVYAQGFFSAPHSSSLHFVQYGVALTTESLAASGGVCPDRATVPCILGPGLGMAVRMGYRSHGPLYFGGAYEATRHDSSNILRLAVLQQLRGEARYVFDRGNRASPYALLGLGVAAYGNEWNVDTAGPSLHLGAGLEFQASTAAIVGFALTWRSMALRRWTDGTGQRRADDLVGFGIAQWIALELTLEIRNPLPRW
ncbi:MAG: hypothetical protein QM784_12405 [Polyangiaceae bacterium]